MSTAQLRGLPRRRSAFSRMRLKRGMEGCLPGVWAAGFVEANEASFVQGVRVLLQEGKNILILPEDQVRITWRGVKRRGSGDLQSGALVRWEPAIKEADQAIRFAYDNQEPCEALKTISRIWEHLDHASELAAARSRLLMGKVDKPLLAELPKWFEDQEPGLRDEEEGQIAANPLAVESAALLVRGALAAVGETDDVEAEVATGPLGRVIIHWQIPGLRLEWLVEATDLPWPSVKVYHLLRRHDAAPPGPPKTRIFHNAFDAVEAFVHAVRGE